MCKHEWLRSQLATIGRDHYWIFGGKECRLCGAFEISKEAVHDAIRTAWVRGQASGARYGDPADIALADFAERERVCRT